MTTRLDVLSVVSGVVDYTTQLVTIGIIPSHYIIRMGAMKKNTRGTFTIIQFLNANYKDGGIDTEQLRNVVFALKSVIITHLTGTASEDEVIDYNKLSMPYQWWIDVLKEYEDSHGATLIY